MPSYTICPKLIEYCSKNPYYLANILYMFVIDRPLKITLDNNKPSVILNDYLFIANRSQEIREWLDFLEKTRGENIFEIIKIKLKKSSRKLYISTCSNIVGEKKLLTENKQYYSFYKNTKKIKILNKEEAKDELSISVNMSILADHKSAISFGNKSNIKIR